jgi:type IV secretory pathway TrbD component
VIARGLLAALVVLVVCRWAVDLYVCEHVRERTR